jgi:hypothetical protein
VEFGGLCLAPKQVGADGVYDQSIEPDGIECVKRLAVRVASTEARRATVYCEAAEVGGGEFVAGNARLPRVAPALEVPPEGSLAAERTVRFEGVEVRVVPERLLPEQGGYGELSGGSVQAEGLCFAPPSLGLVGLYAFWPESDIAGGFGFRVENESGLTPGTRVVFRVLGGLYCSLTEGEVIPEGEFAVIGGGEVDAAGEYVVPDAGVVLPCLSWLGYSVSP